MKLKLKIILCLLFVIFMCFITNIQVVNAQNLSESIEEQLEKIDLSSLESIISEYTENYNFSATTYINEVLKGNFSTDYNNVFKYIFSVISSGIKSNLPLIFAILILSLVLGLLKNLKTSHFSDNIITIVNYVNALAIIIFLAPILISLYRQTSETISAISKFSQIVSPIILTLMATSGATISVSLYKPAVIFFSSGILSIFLNIILPISGIMIIFTLISKMTNLLNLEGFNSFFASIIKWVIGIAISVFSIFLSVQGISASIHDGISYKVAKYTVSNSIPLIGGFLRDGIDLICCGSILIKNAIGVSSIIGLFLIILSPLTSIIIVSLLLKLIGSITSLYSDNFTSSVCFSISKTLSYFLISIIVSAFMFLITILLMIFTASSLF